MVKTSEELKIESSIRTNILYMIDHRYCEFRTGRFPIGKSVAVVTILNSILMIFQLNFGIRINELTKKYSSIHKNTKVWDVGYDPVHAIWYAS